MRGLHWIEKTTKLLDSAFRVPGTQFRVGLDPIIGLIPGVGDVVTLGVQGALLMAMARYGASQKLVIKMLGNVLLDTLVGAIPIVGNLFDFGFKASQRNLKLLKEYHEEGKHRGSGKNIIVTVAVGLVVIFVLLAWGIWAAAAWLLRQGWG